MSIPLASVRRSAEGTSSAPQGGYRCALLRYTDVFDDPGLPGEMITTVTLAAVPMGTELRAVQEGIPEVIPVSACDLGWQESLAMLAQWVEPDIPE